MNFSQSCILIELSLLNLKIISLLTSQLFTLNYYELHDKLWSIYCSACSTTLPTLGKSVVTFDNSGEPYTDGDMIAYMLHPNFASKL